MAKEEKKKKKSGCGCISAIVAIVIIVVMLAGFIFSIFGNIIEAILNIIKNIIKGVLGFLSDPIKWFVDIGYKLVNFVSQTFNGEFHAAGLEYVQPDQLIEISQTSFEAMKNSLDESISKNAVGLDDIMLKKMLLAYNTGKYSKNTDVIIRITDDERAILQDELEVEANKIKNAIVADIDEELINKINALASADSDLANKFKLGVSQIEDAKVSTIVSALDEKSTLLMMSAKASKDGQAIKEKRAKIGQLRLEANHLKDEVNRLEAQLSILENEKDSLQTRKDNYGTDNSTFTTQSNQLKSEATTLRNEAKELKNQATTLKNDAKTLRDSAETLRNEAEELRSEAEELRSKAEELRNEASDLRGEEKETEAVAKESEASSKETQASSKETQASSKETQAANNETQAENKETQAANNETEAERKETQAASKEKDGQELSDALAQGDADLTAQITKKTTDINNLKNTISAKKASIDKNNADADALELAAKGDSTLEDAIESENKAMELKDLSDSLKKRITPVFQVKKGSEIPQIMMNWADRLENTLFTTEKCKKCKCEGSCEEGCSCSGGEGKNCVGDGCDIKLCKQHNYYLCAKGVLTFINEDGEELVYYPEDVLYKIYLEEFQANRYGGSEDYAKSVWKYLSSKAYTDSNDGIKMYSHEKVEEKLVEWTFKPDASTIRGEWGLDHVNLHRQIISESYLLRYPEWTEEWKDKGLLTLIGEEYLGMDGIVDTGKKEYKLQDLEYYSQVSKYATPVEFMIDLLNISSSKEFVNAFIDKMLKNTDITLKIYKISQSTSEEITEEKEEKIDLLNQVSVNASITQWKNSSNAWTAGTGGIVIEDINAWYDTHWVNETIVDIYLNVPKTITDFKVYIWNETTEGTNFTRTYSTSSDAVKKWGNIDAAHDRYRVRLNINDLHHVKPHQTLDILADTERYTTEVKTETKLNILVEKARTWYGEYIFNNHKITEETHQTKKTVDATVLENATEDDGSYEPFMIKNISGILRNGTPTVSGTITDPGIVANSIRIKEWYDGTKWHTGGKAGIVINEKMNGTLLNKVSITLPTDVKDVIFTVEGELYTKSYGLLQDKESKTGNTYTVNVEDIKYVNGEITERNRIKEEIMTHVYTRANPNSDKIFNIKSIGGLSLSEIGSRIERWYSNLGGDDLAYWLTGGPLTMNLYNRWGDTGLQLSDEEELLNIRATYALESGNFDWWRKRKYLPVKLTIKTQEYEIGYLYETVNTYIIQGTPTVRDNTDFFLSLLKNTTGKYSVDATYNPNGIEVAYETVYDSKDKVAKKFVTSAEMFFELLETSDYTRGLVNVMKYILYKYDNTNDYGVTVFNYNIIDDKGYFYY